MSPEFLLARKGKVIPRRGAKYGKGTGTNSGKLLQITFTPVTEQFVSEILQKTVPKSCNLDPIPTELLYKNLDVLLPIITNIINTSLASGFVPPDFKTAIVKPLLKKNSLNHNVLKTYRPISNLPFLSKILAKGRSTQTSCTPPRKPPLQSIPISLRHRTQHRDRTPTRCKRLVKRYG